ncbi:MAG: transporter substrate-binding domain-containing protein [Bacteroidota bacterium]
MHFFWYSFIGLICSVSVLQAQVPESYLERDLRIAVYDGPPFGFLYPDSSFGGLMVEIWEDIAEELELDYTYELTDMQTLLQGLQAKKYDIGLGAISITPKRELLVDFTQAVNPSGTGIAVSASATQNTFNAYWKPILWSLSQLIGSLLIVLLISGFIVWWVERKHSKDLDDDRTIGNLTDALWWSAVTMTTVGYGDKVPHSRIGRVLGIVWIFLSIILLSLFTANASAILTANRLDAHIQTEEDLRHARVGAAARSSGEEFLKRQHISYTPYEDINAAVDAMLKDEIDCVVSNAPVLKYLNNTAYYKKLSIAPELLLKNNMGIALPDDSPLREPIDQILLEKIAEPRWQKAVYRYLGED